MKQTNLTSTYIPKSSRAASEMFHFKRFEGKVGNNINEEFSKISQKMDDLSEIQEKSISEQTGLYTIKTFKNPFMRNKISSNPLPKTKGKINFEGISRKSSWSSSDCSIFSEEASIDIEKGGKFDDSFERFNLENSQFEYDFKAGGKCILVNLDDE